MRKEIVISNNWYFKKGQSLPSTTHDGWERVDLPHTWNAYDGQDGGADYFRGECAYLKELDLYGLREDALYYLEFGAVASQCRVFVNGVLVCEHKGGYSSFRADVTHAIKPRRNTICVCVSNSPVGDIYPQMADFTFFGGIHRAVKLIRVEKAHFDLDHFGSQGLEAHSELDGNVATLHIRSYPVGTEPTDTVRYALLDGEGGEVAEVFCSADEPSTSIELEGIRLWQGVKDPYLYGIVAQIIRNNEVLDSVSISHGFRSFYVDSKKGFFLNGEHTPLRGVSRHGDKLNRGLALTLEDHIRDIRLICEVGANTVRLAHYQHAEEFYDLCDRCGLIVWAEIPFISKMMPSRAAHDNCILQMRELIIQNYNHPSICFWGISNEITIGGASNGLVSNLYELNDLVHSLDPTRLSTMAQVTMLPMDDVQNSITDIVAYNHYFGWYGGKLSDNEAWFDAFHNKYPDRALGISEYGCEGIITYHGESPRAGDYSEEYQAKYHEHMLDLIEKRPWIWGSYVWNMFDFGCDARDEGGVAGRNNKGLVSYDRKIKKDAFYACKAYWSDEPFVHICSKRYYKRAGSKIAVRVYSNLGSISLFVNGEKVGKAEGEHVFVFEDVSLRMGKNTVVACSGEYCDTTVISRVMSEPEHFTLKDEEGFADNWFDDRADSHVGELTFKPGFYSIKNTIREILGSDGAGDSLAGAFASVTGMRLKKSMLMMMADRTPEELLSDAQLTQRLGENAKKLVSILNAELQKIPIKK